MKALFADTYFYLALVGADSKAKARARAVSREWSGKVVTTEWVLAEVANALAEPAYRRVCSIMIDALRADPDTVIIHASHELFDQGWSLYQDRPDKSWSLTDCISFLVMEDNAIIDALTGDHHFEQAGFRALLKSGNKPR